MTRPPRGLLRPFLDAFCGLAGALRRERHMRIHATAVAAVSLTAACYQATAGEWLALLLCFGTVLSAELLNTAIEKLADFCEPEYSAQIKFVKDAAAAGVLAAAAAAVGVAVIVFGDKARWQGLFGLLCRQPALIAGYGVLALGSIAFIFMDGFRRRKPSVTGKEEKK